MFRVRMNGLEGELLGKPKKWSRRRTGYENLILAEYKHDRAFWNRYERRTSAYWSRKFPRYRESRRRWIMKWNEQLKLASNHGMNGAQHRGPKESGNAKQKRRRCIRCRKPAVVEGNYCATCLKEVVPAILPTMALPQRMYRWMNSASLWDDTDPWWDDNVRAYEDG